MLDKFLDEHRNTILGAVYQTLVDRQVHYVGLDYPGGGQLGFSVLPWDEKSERLDTEELLLAYLSGKGEAEAYRTGFNECLERVRRWAIATGIDGQLLNFLAHQEIAELDRFGEGLKENPAGSDEDDTPKN